MNRRDVIILGGGIIGCSLAEELARRGRRVVVLDRGRPGAEASSAAAGILSAQMDVPRPGAFFELCQAARRLYPGWVRRLERASGIRTEYRTTGILYLAQTAAQRDRMAHRAAWQRRRGLRVERWTPAQVRRKEPAVDGAILQGFCFPSEGHLDNVALMQALIRACRRAGVSIQPAGRVRRVLVRRGAVAGVETDQGAVHAPVVVNCLGSWADLGGRFPVRVPVEPARGQMLALRAPRGLVGRPVISDRAYMVQRRDGRLIVGSTIERAGFEKRLTLEGIHAILCGLRRLSRPASACAFLEAWAGFRPRTPDDQPLLGSTGVDGLYVATGHFRHGILLAPVTAQVMAELVLNGRSSFNLAPFSLTRFNA